MIFGALFLGQFDLEHNDRTQNFNILQGLTWHIFNLKIKHSVAQTVKQAMAGLWVQFPTDQMYTLNAMQDG